MKVEVRDDGVVHAWRGRTHFWIRRVQVKGEGKACAINVSVGRPGEPGSTQLTWDQVATVWASKEQLNDLVLALMQLLEKW